MLTTLSFSSRSDIVRFEEGCIDPLPLFAFPPTRAWTGACMCELTRQEMREGEQDNKLETPDTHLWAHVYLLITLAVLKG